MEHTEKLKIPQQTPILIRMRKILNDITTIIKRRPSFDTIGDLNLVTKKIESNVTKFSFKDIAKLERLLQLRLQKEELKKDTKILFKKIKASKAKINNRLKAKREKEIKKEEEKLKKVISKIREQVIIDAIPEIRRYHDGLDDKEHSKQIVEKYEEDYKREKEKNNFNIEIKKGIKKHKPGISITETEEDPLHRK